MPEHASVNHLLADRLHSAAIHLLRHVRRGDVLTGVASAQLSALSALVHGPLTVGALAAAEEVRAPTMSRLLTDMERLGLIRRSMDPEDARVARIDMTAKGRRTLVRGRDLRVAEIEGRIARLSAAQREVIHMATVLIEQMLHDDGSVSSIEHGLADQPAPDRADANSADMLRIDSP
jgi:DNA-binding MarR family transcriptional regulator